MSSYISSPHNNHVDHSSTPQSCTNIKAKTLLKGRSASKARPRSVIRSSSPLSSINGSSECLRACTTHAATATYIFGAINEYPSSPQTVDSSLTTALDSRLMQDRFETRKQSPFSRKLGNFFRATNLKTSHQEI